MKVTKQDISRNYQTGKFEIILTAAVDGYNPMLVKADAQFVADTIDAVFAKMEAHQAEWIEIHGREAVMNAYGVPMVVPQVIERKYAHSWEVQQRLLDKITD